MLKGTLVRWLLRSVAGADRVELVHKGETERTVRTYDISEKCDRDRLDDIAGELLADAQDETDILEVRSSFVIACMSDEKMLASTKLRREPQQAPPEDAQDEPSREGLLSLALFQNRVMFKELCAMPQRQRMIFEQLLELLQKENAALRTELGAMRTLLFKEHGEDLAVAAELAKDSERRTDMLQKAIDGAMEIGKLWLVAASGEDAGAGAAAPGMNGSGGS